MLNYKMLEKEQFISNYCDVHLDKYMVLSSKMISSGNWQEQHRVACYLAFYLENIWSQVEAMPIDWSLIARTRCTSQFSVFEIVVYSEWEFELVLMHTLMIVPPHNLQCRDQWMSPIMNIKEKFHLTSQHMTHCKLTEDCKIRENIHDSHWIKIHWKQEEKILYLPINDPLR